MNSPPSRSTHNSYDWLIVARLFSLVSTCVQKTGQHCMEHKSYSVHFPNSIPCVHVSLMNVEGKNAGR